MKFLPFWGYICNIYTKFIQTLENKVVEFEGIENPWKSDFYDENPRK